MSAIRILILGILNEGTPRHGYEIKQELESWDAAKWANISYGSIYFSLKKMEAEGLLEIISDRSDVGPLEKIVYKITKTGTAKFLDLLRAQWWEIKPIIDPFQVALAFMNYMPKEELILALENRADHLRIFIRSMSRAIPIRLESYQAPRHIAENFKLSLSRMESELGWIESTIEKIKKGELP